MPSNALRLRTAALPVCLLLVCAARGAPEQPLALSLPGAAEAPSRSLSVPLRFPAATEIALAAPAAVWVTGEALAGSVHWPAGAPTNAQMLAYLLDRDGNWYQALWPRALQPGTNRWSFDFSAGSREWLPQGHHGAWHFRARLAPRAVGLRVFATGVYTGLCTVANAALTSAAAVARPPSIALLEPERDEAVCFGMYELHVGLPDRYADPFDPAAIDLSADFETPDGRTNRVAGFYYQGYYRQTDSMGERLVPEGRPEWRVRYCPRQPGVHRFTLRARDAAGETALEPRSFRARPADGPRFARVATNDVRHFETDDGAFFFPIGHNIRSPFDTRMDDQFPWRFRHPEGSSVYQRYFRAMRDAGENLVEIWMCAWSLGIEWSPVIAGYHGLGDYHLGNAWELDDVLRHARECRLYVNLVLNNHGRASTWLDAEWQDNPYNAERGGFLDTPLEFFNHPRALDLQRRLLRYTVARWGWDPSIFAWELWSELNLVGGEGGNQRANQDPRTVNWHAVMGDYLHGIDPNRHMITTHVSNDYRSQNPEICRLRQIDFCAVDAYHSRSDPLHIAALVGETAAFNGQFRKPVLITEFGGSPMAAGYDHLRRELHAALWSSACSPIGGAPLFWWWQLVDEQNMYPMYRAVARFLAGVDRRSPSFVPRQAQVAFDVSDPVSSSQADAVCMASPRLGLGWVFLRPCFQRNSGPLEKPLENLTATFDGFAAGRYRVEFWDTQTGQVVRRFDARASDDRLILAVPPIRSDFAFKFWPADGK